MKKAFTLIELLVVLVIIGLLLAMITPVMGRARTAARSALCANNLRQLFLAASLFAADKGYYPRSYLPDREPDFFSNYLDSDKETLRCPEVKGYFDEEEPVYSYGWFWFKAPYVSTGAVFSVFMEKRSSQVPMFADASNAMATNQYVLDMIGDLWQDKVSPAHPYDFNGNGEIGLGDLILIAGCWEVLSYRHGKCANIIYLDGHAERIRE